MQQRRPFQSDSPANIGEVARFIHEWSRGAMPQAQAKKVLSYLIASDEFVSDYWENGQRIGVAVLIDTCENARHSTELSLFGDFVEPLYQRWLEWGLALTKQSGRKEIELPEWRRGSFPPAWLESQGIVPSYHTVHMRRMAAPLPAAPPLPEGATWTPYDPSALTSYLETMRLSLGTVPGAFIPEPEAFAQTVRESPFPPQLLVKDGIVIGFVRCSLRGEWGELTALGRHPHFRGQGVGRALVHRGISQLTEAGLEKTCLEVVTENPTALALYESFGYEAHDRTTVFAKKEIPGD